MDWKIRKRGTAFDPIEAYGNDPDAFSIRMVHGGLMTGFMRRAYVGGDFDYIDWCDTDKMSLEELKTMAKQLGRKEEQIIYFVEPNADFNEGRRLLQRDADIRKMCTWVETHKVLDIYCVKAPQFPNLVMKKKPSSSDANAAASSNLVMKKTPISSDGNEEAAGSPNLVMKKKPSICDGNAAASTETKVTSTSTTHGLVIDTTQIPERFILIGDDDDSAVNVDDDDDSADGSSSDERESFTDDEEFCKDDVLLESWAADVDEQVEAVDGNADEWGSQVTNATPDQELPEFEEQEEKIGSAEGSVQLRSRLKTYVTNAGNQVEKESFSKQKKVSFSTTLIMGSGPNHQKKGKSSLKRPQLDVAVNESKADEGELENFTALLDGSMVDDEIHSNEGSSDEEENGDGIKYIDFNADRDMREPKFQVGMRFCNSREFKDAIKNYSIWKRKPIRFTTNEKYRVRAKCQVGCPWVVYASIQKTSKTKDLVIKTYKHAHADCDHAHKNKNITAKWVANRYEERVRSNPNIPTREIRQTIHEDCEASVSKVVAYRGRRIALGKIVGDATEQYKKIWEYCDEIKRTHPNTTMEVEFTPFRTETGNPRFMRVYCCLGPLKAGFQQCRPIIGLDGCHIKGPYPGQLLTAIGIEPNNGFWPIAWALVEREATLQWKWFLELLRKDLEVENSFHYTFISDQQKGLDRALSEILPNSEHRYCVEHMYRNFKKKHPGQALKNMMKAIARSSNMEMFNRAMDDLKEYDAEAFAWVKKAPHPQHWCKAFFSPRTKCDMVTNNLCESFNAFILDARDKPVITCMESIRELVMERIQKRKATMSRYPHPAGPLVRKILEERLKDSFKWTAIYNGVDGFQVRGPRGSQFAVDLRKKECGCGLWELCGLPCCHAIAALKSQGLSVHECIDDCYKKEHFLVVYENVLYPINGMDNWRPSLIGLTLDPPLAVVQPGRPKKARRRDKDEGKDHGHKLKRRVIIHCRKCGNAGHNAATCSIVAIGDDSPQVQRTSRAKKQTVRRKKNPPVGQIENPHASAPHNETILHPQHGENLRRSPRKRQSEMMQPQSKKTKTAPAESNPQEPQGQNLRRSPRNSLPDIMQSQVISGPVPSAPIETIPSASIMTEQTSQPLRRSPRKSGKMPLTDADKGRINANCAYLGQPIPFTVGRWKRGGFTFTASRSGRGRGRPPKRGYQ